MAGREDNPAAASAGDVRPPDWARAGGSRNELSRHAQAGLARIASPRTWHKGEVLMHAGEPAPYVVVVEEGRVRNFRIGRGGLEDLRQGLPPDALLGYASVLTMRPCRFSLVAEEACRTTLYDAGRFRALVQADGRMAMELATMLALRVQSLEDATQELREERLIDRIHSALLRLRSSGEARPVAGGAELRISQYDLACVVGSTRQHVNPQLKRLQELGVVRLGYRSIVLLDAPGPPAQRPFR